MSQLKLHLGCGQKSIEGFINIDSRYTPNVDKVENIRFLRSFEENSVDLIYACHVLEHIGRYDYPSTLKRWYELLKPGGILRVAVPDFEALCRYYLETKRLDDVAHALYSAQDHDGNFHFWTWDFETLSHDLEMAGFIDVRRYDRHKTEHAHVRDWSLFYMPTRNAQNKELPDEIWFQGILVSLNVEASKA